nr:MAG TPA: hypothetical protein [Bacteriophage sp.]
MPLLSTHTYNYNFISIHTDGLLSVNNDRSRKKHPLRF